MWYLSRAALNSGVSVATVLMALTSGRAQAADDPFPLDPGVAAPPPAVPGITTVGRRQSPMADHVFYASVTVNGRELARVVKLREREDRLYIARDSLAYVGLPGSPADAEFVEIAQIAGVGAVVDWTKFHLDLTVRSLDNPGNVVDYRRPAAAPTRRVTPLTALIVDYDIAAKAGPAGLGLASQVDAGVVRDNFAIHSGWTYATGEAISDGIVRLDTALQIDNPRHLRTLTVGDFIQATGADARAVRLGGIRLASNFALQPDFISYPLPDFAGSLAVPQQLDLIVNDRRLSREDLQAGTFSLRNIPVAAGRGRLGVVVRDSLGREQYLGLDYYASRNLLDRGVSQWAVNIGRIRRGFGRVSNDYGPLASSLFLRHGVTRNLTLGVTTEAGNGLINFGGEGTVTLGALAELSAGLRTSRLTQSGVSRKGEAVSFSLTSAGHTPSLRFSGRAVSRGYDDLASASGDAPPTNFLALAADFDLGKFGGISLSGVRERDTRPGPKVSGLQTRHVASLSWRNSFGRVNLFADLSWRRFEKQGNTAAFIGLSIPFGARALASATLVHDAVGGDQLDLSYERPAIVPDDVGYGLRLQTGRSDLLRGKLAYQGRWGRVEAEAEVVNGAAASRFSTRGALVLAGGSLFAVKDNSGGMVLVDPHGVVGVELSRQNLPVAKAGRGKPLLVTDLVARTPMRIGIVPTTLPSGAVADSLGELVAVPSGAVAKLDLGIRPYRPALVRLLDHTGQPFAPGTRVRALPSGAETIVGFDSMVELNTAAADRRLAVDLDDGSICHAELEVVPEVKYGDPAPERADRATLRCYGRMRSFPIAAGGKR